MNALHNALHQFVQLSGQSDSDFFELAAQLDVLQQCFMAGMTPEQIARLLSVLFDEAREHSHQPRYVRQELEFEAKRLSSGLDRRALAIQAVAETAGTGADWALSDRRALRRFG